MTTPADNTRAARKDRWDVLNKALNTVMIANAAKKAGKKKAAARAKK